MFVFANLVLRVLLTATSWGSGVLLTATSWGSGLKHTQIVPNTVSQKRLQGGPENTGEVLKIL